MADVAVAASAARGVQMKNEKLGVAAPANQPAMSLNRALYVSKPHKRCGWDIRGVDMLKQCHVMFMFG